MTYRIDVAAATEPEHEVAEKLLDLAVRHGFDVNVVKVSRDEGLSFLVPDEVGEEFAAGRAEWWPDASDEEVDDDGDPATPPVRRRGRPPKTATQE